MNCLGCKHNVHPECSGGRCDCQICAEADLLLDVIPNARRTDNVLGIERE